MVDLKDLLNAVKPKDDGKKGGLDDLIGGAIDAISGDSKKGGLDDLIGGAISSLTGNKDDVKETKSSDRYDHQDFERSPYFESTYWRYQDLHFKSYKKTRCCR